MIKRLALAAAGKLHCSVTGKIDYLLFHVTARCNASCSICFTARRRQGRDAEQELNLVAIEKLARSMKPLPQVTLSGGEPVLREDVFEIIRTFYRHAGTRFFTVPTNGLSPARIDQLIAQFEVHCPSAFLNICLPFHGPKPTFERIVGISGSFESMRQTYNLVAARMRQSRTISCLLDCVVNQANQAGGYREIAELALKEFPQASFGFAYIRGNPQDEMLLDISPGTYRAACQYLTSLKKRPKRFNPYAAIFDAIGELITDEVLAVAEGRITNLRCHAGKRFIVIYEDGTVAPCELYEQLPEALGYGCEADYICGVLADFDYDLYRLLSSNQAQDCLSRIRTANCACTWECAIASKLLHSPRSLGRLGLKLATRWMGGRSKFAANHDGSNQ